MFSLSEPLRWEAGPFSLWKIVEAGGKGGLPVCSVKGALKWLSTKKPCAWVSEGGSVTQFNGRTRICYGDDAIDTLETLTGHHALIVTESFLVELGFADRVISGLERANIHSRVLDGVEPDPSLDSVREGTVALLTGGADLVVALGGGSAIDTAKAMVFFACKAEPARDKPLLVAIPTTSGTGSEVTAVAMVTEGQAKLPLADDLIVPDIAVLDARFTRSVPPGITAGTGMDTLAHALEAFVATTANAFTDLYALSAIEYVFRTLLRCYRNGDDMEARQNMLLASCMAGVAFTNSGLGVAHSIANALGGIFHIPHSKAIAPLLPYAIRFNSFDIRDRYQIVARHLGFPCGTAAQGTESLIEAVRCLNNQMGIASRIRDLGVGEAEFQASFEALARQAMADGCTGTNPRRPSLEDIRQLLRQAY